MDFKHNRIQATSLALLILGLPVSANAQAVTEEPKSARQLQPLIERQQEQLRQQAEQLRLQSQKLDILQQQVNALQRREPDTNSAATTTVTKTQQETASRTGVGFGNERIKLSVSGQVNRAVNSADDGAGARLYFVDNSASGSRIRLVGSGEMDEALIIGARIEFAVAPDVSSQVSQTNQAPGTYFDQRWTEVSVASAGYGKVSVGKGDTASNTTAEMDLSRTDMVQYSYIVDFASAMLFREKGRGAPLTNLKLSDVFQNRDGLSRQSRLRYDTPVYNGFSLAGSLVSNQRSDAALFWNNEGNGFKAAGAMAVSDPRLPNSGLQYDGSVSILHQDSGLNLTLSGGVQRKDSAGDPANFYVKLGRIIDQTGQGHTALGIDYTRSENLPAAGDRGRSVGAAVVRAFSCYATEVYLQYRLLSLDRVSGPPVADLSIWTFGIRVKL